MQGSTSNLATVEARNPLEKKKKFDYILESAIAEKKQKYNPHSCEILSFSVVHHWVEGQFTERLATHNFVVFAQGAYTDLTTFETRTEHLTFNFEIKEASIQDMQSKFDDKIMEIREQKVLSSEKYKDYSILNLIVLNHEITLH